MGCLVKLSVIVVLVAVLAGLAMYATQPDAAAVEQLLKECSVDGWFGRGERPEAGGASGARRFDVELDAARLDQLRARLNASRHRLPEGLQDVTDFEYGVHPHALRAVIDYWLDRFDWPRQLAALNRYQHFAIPIEGLDVHFVHLKATNRTNVRPLLLIHGWPGSFYEFYRLLPWLADGDKLARLVQLAGQHNADLAALRTDLSFDIVVASIPGFTFSEAAHRRGMNPTAVARIFYKLMQAMGYKKFYVHGGDWGGFISYQLGLFYPDAVLGLHSSIVAVGQGSLKFKLLNLLALFAPTLMLPADEQWKTGHPNGFISWLYALLWEEGGYFHLQGTKPHTIGVALEDSPAGLAAYLLEKYSTWTNRAYMRLPDGGLLETSPIHIDHVLTTIMLYYMTDSATSSVRIYREFCNSECDRLLAREPVRVPVGLACFRHELACAPRMLVAERFPQLVQYSDLPNGGHFAALEVPDALAADIVQFILKTEARQQAS